MGYASRTQAIDTVRDLSHLVFAYLVLQYTLDLGKTRQGTQQSGNQHLDLAGSINSPKTVSNQLL